MEPSSSATQTQVHSRAASTRASSFHALPPNNPFQTPTPGQSSRASFITSTAGDGPQSVRSRRKFVSSRFASGEYEKPWVGEKDKRRRWEPVIFWVSVVIGIAIGAVICALTYLSVPNFEYCLILEDNFNEINTEVWNYEIQRGGFGTGSFDWTTDDEANAYVDADGLHIVPTLTTDTTDITESEIMNNYVLNLTQSGVCTSESKIKSDCVIRSNKTSGAIVNPVRSARLNTQGRKTLTYGRVEVTALMPEGDWLWPAIWMMPEPQGPEGAGKYGPWPASGEIDIAELRGNAPESYPDGRDTVGSALHWGPIAEADAFYKTNGKHVVRRTDYSKAFHTYGLEWSEKYLFTYIDTRLVQVLYTSFTDHSNMWSYGDFGTSLVNDSALNDPWSATGNANTPFDQPFYLILNVAVGATNGWFPDQVGDKPWGDESPTAMKEFWEAKDQWLPTWGEGDSKGMTVSSVKMWSQGACGSGPVAPDS